MEILELKFKTVKIKDLLDGLNRLDTAEERNNEFEYISLETIQLKQSERGKKGIHVHTHTQKMTCGTILNSLTYI